MLTLANGIMPLNSDIITLANGIMPLGNGSYY